jgi:hypothetical protein
LSKEIEGPPKGGPFSAQAQEISTITDKRKERRVAAAMNFGNADLRARRATPRTRRAQRHSMGAASP